MLQTVIIGICISAETDCFVFKEYNPVGDLQFNHSGTWSISGSTLYLSGSNNWTFSIIELTTAGAGGMTISSSGSQVILENQLGQDPCTTTGSSSSSSSSSGGSSSSSSSGGSSSATVQFHLQATYSNRPLECLLPLTIKVYKVPTITGVNYCQYGSSECSCGASFLNNIPSSSQPQSYGTGSINIAANSPGCGASGVASYTLPVGNYMYRWESTVCCNQGGWNKKCFGYNGSFFVSTSDTQQSCKTIQVYMPNLASTNSAGLDWINDNCQ